MEGAGPYKGGLLREWGGLLAGIAGVLTAAGALFKSCDHSVTESAYVTLGQSIAKLSDQQQRDHADLAGLRGYMDGMSRTPSPAFRLGATPSSVALTPLDRSTLWKPVPIPVPSPDAVPVPTISPAPRPVRAPDFSTIK